MGSEVSCGRGDGRVGRVCLFILRVVAGEGHGWVAGWVGAGGLWLGGWGG